MAAPVRVHDPLGARHDPKLPSLALALHPIEAKRRLKHRLPRLAGPHGVVRVRQARVTRYKPGRRCVVEYDVRVLPADGDRTKTTLVGKVRARRFGKEGYELLDRLWEAGFSDRSADGVAVPEPIATVADLRMWLQRKAPGQPATELLAGPSGAQLGARIAEAAHKLHRAGVPAPNRHTLADELSILRACLRHAAALRPRLAGRIERVAAACLRLAGRVGEPAAPCGIHRDFYGDQVIVDGDRLFLIDFDLYCLGDPALDLGNFLGHVTEQSLRTTGDPGTLAAVEEASRERFLALAREELADRVDCYALLTLARHVYLSATLPGRAAFTAPILGVCEERLAAFRPARAA